MFQRRSLRLPLCFQEGSTIYYLKYHWWFSEKEYCIIRLCSHVVEYGSVPELFHKIPILNDATSHRVDDVMAVLAFESFVTNEEI
jgi:hypothetical protein